MGGVISPVRQKAGGTTKRFSDYGSRLSYDGVYHLLSPARCSVRRQHQRLIACLRDRDCQQDRFDRGTTHSAARKIHAESVALRRLARALKKCRAKVLSKFLELLTDPVRAAYRSLSCLFPYPMPALCRDRIAAAVGTPLATQELHTGPKYTPAAQLPCRLEKCCR